MPMVAPVFIKAANENPALWVLSSFNLGLAELRDAQAQQTLYWDSLRLCLFARLRDALKRVEPSGAPYRLAYQVAKMPLGELCVNPRDRRFVGAILLERCYPRLTHPINEIMGKARRVPNIRVDSQVELNYLSISECAVSQFFNLARLQGLEPVPQIVVDKDIASVIAFYP